MRGLASERAVIGGVTVELGDWLVVDTERHGKSRRARFRGEDPSGRIVVQSKGGPLKLSLAVGTFH